MKKKFNIIPKDATSSGEKIMYYAVWSFVVLFFISLTSMAYGAFPDLDYTRACKKGNAVTYIIGTLFLASSIYQFYQLIKRGSAERGEVIVGGLLAVLGWLTFAINGI